MSDILIEISKEMCGEEMGQFEQAAQHLKKRDISFWLDNDSQFWLDERRHSELAGIKARQREIREEIAVHESADLLTAAPLSTDLTAIDSSVANKKLQSLQEYDRLGKVFGTLKAKTGRPFVYKSTIDVVSQISLIKTLPQFNKAIKYAWCKI